MSRPLLVLVATLAAAPAAAVPLAPGDVVFPAGTTVAASPQLAGVVLNDDLIPFSIDPSPGTPFTAVSGQVQNRVVRSDQTGALIFGPRIRDTINIATTQFDVIGFNLIGYGGFDLDVDFRTDGLGDDGPTSASRSADGNTLTFRYDDPLQIDGVAPGVQEESLFPSIETGTPNFALEGRMTIFGVDPAQPDTTFEVSIGGLAVPAPIPLPGAGWALVAALAGLAAASRRARA